jgi:molybdopterin synthase sulfur carrier subunit
MNSVQTSVPSVVNSFYLSLNLQNIMTANILAFGIAKDIFGASSIIVELPVNALAGDLKIVLEDKYPRLKQLASYLLAVNNEYAGDDLTLNERDEIAVIPPVSGG